MYAPAEHVINIFSRNNGKRLMQSAKIIIKNKNKTGKDSQAGVSEVCHQSVCGGGVCGFQPVASSC